MLAQVLVIVDIVHEAVAVTLRSESELAVFNFLVCRDIESVIAVAITIHIVCEHIGVVGSSPPGLINEAEVVAALVAMREGCDEAVRSDILGVVELEPVRSCCRRNVCEC